MHETFMSDSEDEGADDNLGDHSFRYLTADEMKSLGDDSLPIDVTRDERVADQALAQREAGYIAPLTQEEDRLSPSHMETVFNKNLAPDNVDISRQPIMAGKLKWKTFLVSFMVDARGGAMRGCRHSGVRVIIPPRRAPMPMRVTCRYLRKERLVHPPPLMEGEACASRILEVGPAGAKFLGPVILEVPHFASLRGREREICILRSDNGETWKEHPMEATEEAVHEVLSESFDGSELSALEDLSSNRITRILTTDFPQYFAIVTRTRQEVHTIGPEGGMVSSTVVPQVQAIFPEGALTKKIKVGLQAQPISSELVTKLLGNRVAISPIVTVEPRRRKFHKPITLTIPVPQAASKGMINQYSGDTPTLRLLCSITGGTTKAQWEDVTGSTPLTFVNDCVSFTTTVSARFWLMDCRQVNEATRFATELYNEAVHVPFMAKFVVFSKRTDPMEAQMRVFCMTDDKEDKTLEVQEHFQEVAKSRDVEVLENKPAYLEFAGNLVPITKSGEQLNLTFQAFRENRIAFNMRVKDIHQDPLGRIIFMKESRSARSDAPQAPICNLNIQLPDVVSPSANLATLTWTQRDGFGEETGLFAPDAIHKAQIRLNDLCRDLGGDWVHLAKHLNIPQADIENIQKEHPDNEQKQAVALLRLWIQRNPSVNGNMLERALRKIHRDTLIRRHMHNIAPVTDELERAVAKVELDQPGFDTLKDELGSSRSLKRDASLDVSYDERDMTKEAESAEETSSEAGSLRDKQKSAPKAASITEEPEIVASQHALETGAKSTKPAAAAPQTGKPSKESDKGKGKKPDQKQAKSPTKKAPVDAQLSAELLDQMFTDDPKKVKRRPSTGDLVADAALGLADRSGVSDQALLDELCPSPAVPSYPPPGMVPEHVVIPEYHHGTRATKTVTVTETHSSSESGEPTTTTKTVRTVIEASSAGEPVIREHIMEKLGRALSEEVLDDSDLPAKKPPVSELDDQAGLEESFEKVQLPVKREIEEARTKTPPASPAEGVEEVHRTVQVRTEHPDDGTVVQRMEAEETTGSMKRTITAVTKTTVVQDTDDQGGIPQMVQHHQQILSATKPLESETSGDMDTSQVSVSSLPEDERTDEATATLSSTTATGGEPETHTEANKKQQKKRGKKRRN